MHDAAPYRQSAELGLIDLGYPVAASEELLQRIAAADSPTSEARDWAHDRLLDLLKRRRDGREPADALPYVQAMTTLMEFAAVCEPGPRRLADVVA